MIFGFMRESAQDEFLCQVGGGPLAGCDKEIPQKQPDSAIRRRIVGMEMAAEANRRLWSIVRLPLPVISSSDEWSLESVQNSRLRCASALVEVARVLVQE